MGSLYEITNEMVEFLALAEDPDIDPVAFADTLEGLQFELEKKAEGYCKVLRQMESDIEAIKAEEDRLKRNRSAIENNVKRMKEALKDAMVKTGHDDKNGLKAGLFQLKVAKNGGQRPLVIDGDVPEQFIKVKYENDNERIRAFLNSLDNNDACAWAHLGEAGTHLAIK